MNMKKSSFIRANKHRKDRKVDVATVAELTRIFKRKTWEVKDDSDNQLSLFNRFISTLTNFSPEQRKLILELTERFDLIPSSDYEAHIKIALNNLLKDTALDLSEINSIYVAPLIAERDFGKNKSSKYVQYSLPNLLPYYSQLGNKKIIPTNELELPSNVKWETSILLVVDDFIGTGNTAKEAIGFLIDKKEIATNNIIVLSIAALREGISLIKNLNVRIYTSMELKKGITDFYSAEEIPNKLEIMDEIEGKIKRHKNEKYGYGKSEGLIKLIRTPNNTFPVFWKEKGGRIAPFPRK